MLPFLLEWVMMFRTILILFLLITYHLLLITPVSAHTFGQPPFFTINDVYSILYPVPTSSASEFTLPQDLAVDNYLVGQTLVLELVQDKLPAPKEVVDQTEFSWDFGDGTKGTGLKNTHTYSKPGSYILSIDAKFKTDPQPQLLQSVMFHILPSKDYKLPQASIRANGKVSRDPLSDILHLKFDQNVQLDGSSSMAGGSKIVSYIWDLGDTNSSDQKSVSHKYDPQLNQIFPVLRVIDEQGLISDSFVEIENSEDFNQNPVGFVGEGLKPQNLIDSENPVAKTFIYGLATIVALGGGFLVLKFMRKSRKKKN